MQGNNFPHQTSISTGVQVKPLFTYVKILAFDCRVGLGHAIFESQDDAIYSNMTVRASWGLLKGPRKKMDHYTHMYTVWKLVP